MTDGDSSPCPRGQDRRVIANSVHWPTQIWSLSLLEGTWTGLPNFNEALFPRDGDKANARGIHFEVISRVARTGDFWNFAGKRILIWIRNCAGIIVYSNDFWRILDGILEFGIDKNFDR